ncbi:MAG: IMP cyclohydrolase [Proteobacteria bacterium]|jgi:phosphoribosylaminoimidazolecarboxamide formyltransferase/IMP cyclohydrolase|nr:IMP cyclohydrolase [Desulfocapsa sp.]MBU3945849.1 IMP cyclohydrolase [Pseudomonadota bacterium]MCG2745573.1 IMP cyclohydrolase [Desulfobacteraceae bacterium]MBU3982722.1 IMP cyclohydrolase [Pseudomonadota bacterium]MBU4027697.1 IMP cyclohydrolase [Pseudomonadota bacterium]
MNKITRALISLTDKSGIEGFARELADLGVELLSTGGTAKKIREAGIPVKDVSEFTGFPEMLDGRVKTLHPKVHGGILNQRDNAEHQRQCVEHDLKPIDLIAVNLYAFEKTIADPNCSLADAIENIDIGGPTMLRASAKNFHDVTVIVDPADYPQVLKEIKEQGNTTLKTRFRLAAKVFSLTSKYDTAISAWLDKVDVESNPYFAGKD